jgi:dimethylhistidine N-methyltransferase
MSDMEALVSDVDLADDAAIDEILAGLRAEQKHLPTRYFYDRTGSLLFDEITRLDEYYLTRTECGILERHLPEMVERLSRRDVLIEYGSGLSSKTRLLLDHMPTLSQYVPVDISSDVLRSAADELRAAYPSLDVVPIHADYTQSLRLGELGLGDANVFFPGSTIGNFERHEAVAFLRRIAATVGRGGGLLVGVDVNQDVRSILPAYNDPAGVTAAFNRNMLSNINDLFGSDFEPEHFEHLAIYNRAAHRIEMYLVSDRAQRVRLNGAAIDFGAGEAVRTEYSHKYPLDVFAEMADAAGFEVVRVWTDEAKRFSVQFLVVR